MSWARNLASTLASASAACALAGAAHAAIVVASSGPSAAQYPAGKQLADTARVVLKEGDSVTILDQRGTRVLKGAGSFSVNQASGPRQTATFAALTRPRASQRVRTGAVRTGVNGAKVMSPNLWYVDLGKPGTQCIVDSAAVRLWRAASDAPASYRIGTGSGVTITFRKGESVAAWPAGPIAAGSSFALADGAGAPLGTIRFAILGQLPATPEATAAALIAQGCAAQLDLLAASLAPAR